MRHRSALGMYRTAGNCVYSRMAQTWTGEPFDLPVIYKGTQIILPSVFYRWGYSYKIMVEIEGRQVYFEPDEERNFRAVAEGESRVVPVQVLQAIAEALEQAFR